MNDYKFTHILNRNDSIIVTAMDCQQAHDLLWSVILWVPKLFTWHFKLESIAKK